jgi:pimeloyl-[acyl-carrier protein] methyl ester esterase
MSKLNIVIDIVGKGTPLVLLHGWGFDSSIWQPLLPLLQQRYKLYLVDLPGFGKSPLIDEEYHFKNIVPKILAHLPPKADWLGWSLGGLVATWTAIHYPDRVNRLISMASSPRFVSDTDWPGMSQAVLEKFSEKLIHSPTQTLAEFLELQLRGHLDRDELLPSLRKKINSTTYSTRALLGGLMLLAETDIRNELKKITSPTFFLYGQIDTIVPSTLANLTSSLLPGSQYEVIRRAGHMPFLTHTDTFLNLLNQFLS